MYKYISNNNFGKIKRKIQQKKFAYSSICTKTQKINKNIALISCDILCLVRGDYNIHSAQSALILISLNYPFPLMSFQVGQVNTCINQKQHMSNIIPLNKLTLTLKVSPSRSDIQHFFPQDIMYSTNQKANIITVS